MNHLQKLLASNRRRGRFEIDAKADAKEATVYLYDMIVDNDTDAEWCGGVSAESFVKEFASIKAETIHLRVNSPGGSVFGGRSMEQAIRQHSAKVIAHVDGLAASAASFVIMAADEIRMAPGAFLMIHKAWSIAMGNADEFRKNAEILDQIDTSLANTYSRRTGIDASEITDMLDAETWLESSVAVEKKFADAVEEDAKKATNAIAWDLSAFKAPPAPAKDESAPAKDKAQQPDRDALRRNALRALIPA